MTVTSTTPYSKQNYVVHKVVTTDNTETSELYNVQGATSVWVVGTGASAIQAWLPTVQPVDATAPYAPAFDVPDHGSEGDPNYEISSVSTTGMPINPGTTSEPLFIAKNAMPAYVYFKFGVAGTYYVHINYA